MSEADDDHLVQLGKAMRNKANGKGPYQANEHTQSVDIGGASITQVGISEKSLIMFVWLPLGVALIAAMAALGIAAFNSGTSQGAVYAAQMAERNAKLAQYQTELALKRAGIELPTDVTEKPK